MVFAAALTGIQSSSSELAVIGNNIANASTTGFKSSRTEFADIYTSSGGSNAIGSGVGVSSVTQKHSQGSIAFTNSNLDLAISGEGYFQMKDSTGVTYTRAGSFSLDQAGKVVNSAGKVLQGQLANTSGVIGGTVTDIQIPSGSSAPNATSTINLGLNVDSRSTPPTTAFAGGQKPSDSTYNNISSTTIYDSKGNSHILQSYYIKADSVQAPVNNNAPVVANDKNQWYVAFQIDGNDLLPGTPGTTNAANLTAVNFNNDGTFAGVSASTTTSPVTEVGTSNVLQLDYDLQNGAEPLYFTVDFNNIAFGGTTEFGAYFAIQSSKQDGYSQGSLQNIEVDNNGVIIGRFSNGQTRDLAQLATANFANASGLQPQGDTGWTESSTSGTALIGKPGSGGLGSVTAGALEQSNVDLTAQLVALITAQRNFQANAQSIRTGDTVAQTIINLR